MGESWKESLEHSLQGSQFLLPILTPCYFGSEQCLSELRFFLTKEKELGRRDLILPLYYATCDVLENNHARGGNDLAQILSERQRADLRNSRFLPVDSPEVDRLISLVAGRIKDALVRTAKQMTQSDTDAALQRPVIRVHASDEGACRTISEAISLARPGTTIKIGPGKYQGPIVLEEDLTVEGEDGDVVSVLTENQPAISIGASRARVSRLKVVCSSPGHGPAVKICRGNPELEQCDIASDGESCIHVCGDANPHIRQCRMSGLSRHGLILSENCREVAEGNDLSGFTLSAIEVMGEASVVLRRNLVHHCRDRAIYVHRGLPLASTTTSSLKMVCRK